MEFLPLIILGILIPLGLLFWAYRVVKLFDSEKSAQPRTPNKKTD
jgi:hypothetical protein